MPNNRQPDFSECLPQRTNDNKDAVIADLEGTFLCCSVLQCVAVCCSVLQCVAVCCSVCFSMLQYVAVCCSYCSVLNCKDAVIAELEGALLCCSVLQCVAVCCVCRSVLQYVAVCYNLLQCAALQGRCDCPLMVHFFAAVCFSACCSVCYSVLHYIAVCCSLLHCKDAAIADLDGAFLCCIVLQCVLQCVFPCVFCTVLHCKDTVILRRVLFRLRAHACACVRA